MPPLKCSIFYMFLFILCVACGLDTVAYLEAPKKTYHVPGDSSSAQSEEYFEFTATNVANSAIASAYFQGFEVYYRIYDDQAQCKSEIDAIKAYNDQSPYNARTYLVETKQFKRLTLKNSASPLINKAAADTIVKIRLQDYGSSDKAAVKVDGLSLGTPLRVDGNSFDDAPENSDKDFLHSNGIAQSPPPSWFVAMYAVSYGLDSSIVPLYSSLCPLGFVELP